MAQTSAVLSLPYIQAAQAQKHVTHNEALRLLDLIVQPVVQDASRTTPPPAPAVGDRHIVATGATDIWTGQEGAIAAWEGSAWLFAVPQAGWQARDLSSGTTLYFDGTSWAADASAGGTGGGSSGPFTTLGVNATADTTNRLTVSSDAVLLNNAGAGHQLKINKAAATDTASLLFQTGFSGRAEMGTAGTDAFAIKVSDDGATFVTALSFDGATGAATGAAVQASAADTTAGRLMRADWGYGPGNLVGSVSQAGGVPTGAVLETGSNSDGDYVRFADGTQVCSQTLTLAQLGNDRLSGSWTFPMAFTASPMSVSGTLDADDLSNTAPNAPDLGAFLHSSLTATGVSFAQYRVTGATNFATSDAASCRVSAVGRWF